MMLDLTKSASPRLSELGRKYDQVFVLTDEQVARCCLPVFHSIMGYQPKPQTGEAQPLEQAQPIKADFPMLVLPSGEQHKTLASVQRIWDFLFEHHATRTSLLINLGGGVICDMGGFAASTYMRSMAYMNVPTTLLAMVDAATGGKTGIDYRPTTQTGVAQPIKNAIGTFAEPVDTLIEPAFLATLPPKQLLSGFAEMLKHAILQSPQALGELLEYDLRQVATPAFGCLIRQSVAFKQSVVEQDPHDHGIRQILNFGHTIGHAIEALTLSRNDESEYRDPEKSEAPFNFQFSPFNYTHGFCVMYGMVAEAYLSHIICGLPAEVVSTLSRYMLENYGAAPITCNDYDALLQLMQHDKKNTSRDSICCPLLRAIGDPVTGQHISPDSLREALEYLCSL